MTKRFQKPTLCELDAYAVEIGFNTFDGHAFLDHYDMVGWVVGKNRLPMKDWKAAVRTWRRNQQTWASQQESRQPTKQEQRAVLDRIDQQHIKDYADQITAIESWLSNPDACPYGNPRDELDLLWRKIKVNHGPAFVLKLRTHIKRGRR